MKILFSVLFLSFFFIANSLIGQAVDYHPGQILKSDGDTLYGQVGLEDIIDMSFGVQFRERPGGEIVRLLPGEVRTVRYDTVDLQLQSIEHDTYDRSTKQVEKTNRIGQLVFASETFELIKLHQGLDEYDFKYIPAIPHVFYLRDKRRNETYLLNVEEKIESLNKYTVRNNYRGVLKFVLNDWPAHQSRIDRSDLETEDLVDLLSDYQQAVLPATTVDYVYRLDEEKQKKQRRSALEIGTNFPVWNSPWDHGTNFSLGYFYEYQKPLRNKRSINRIGVEFSSVEVLEGSDNYASGHLYLLKAGYGKLRAIGAGDGDFVTRFRWGVSTYFFQARTTRDRFQVFELPDGSTERRVVGTEEFNEFGFFPITADLGLNFRYRRLYLDVFTESHVYGFLLKEHGLFNIAGLRLGYYLNSF